MDRVGEGHRFAGGPPPEAKPRYGTAHAASQRSGWYRHLAAWAVGSGLLGLAIVLIGDPGRTTALTQVVMLWALVLAIDFAISFSYTLSPRRAELR